MILFTVVTIRQFEKKDDFAEFLHYLTPRVPPGVMESLLKTGEANRHDKEECEGRVTAYSKWLVQEGKDGEAAPDVRTSEDFRAEIAKLKDENTQLRDQLLSHMRLPDTKPTPPWNTFKGATCKGSWKLGNHCGQCDKCKWELANG